METHFWIVLKLVLQPPPVVVGLMYAARLLMSPVKLSTLQFKYLVCHRRSLQILDSQLQIWALIKAKQRMWALSVCLSQSQVEHNGTQQHRLRVPNGTQQPNGTHNPNGMRLPLGALPLLQLHHLRLLKPIRLIFRLTGTLTGRAN